MADSSPEPQGDLLRERLPRFLNTWREKNRLTDPRPLSDVHEVALALVARGDLESGRDDASPESVLTDHLHPILVKTPNDDLLFRDLWKRYVGDTEPLPEEILTDSSAEPQGEDIVSGAGRFHSFRWRWLALIPAAVILAGGW